jgi:hypothetical protein
MDGGKGGFGRGAGRASWLCSAIVKRPFLGAVRRRRHQALGGLGGCRVGEAAGPVTSQGCARRLAGVDECLERGDAFGTDQRLCGLAKQARLVVHRVHDVAVGPARVASGACIGPSEAPPRTPSSMAELGFSEIGLILAMLTQGPAVMIDRPPPPAAPKSDHT